MSTCTYTVDERGVALMIINNPPMNALSSNVLKDLNDTITKALEDDSVRVIVFTGDGKAFIAGADIKEIDKVKNAAEGEKFTKIGHDLFNKIENADKPFIAAINGYALGGGLELALACHIRLADEKAQLGFPEIKLGVIPGYGGTQRSPRTFGSARAMEMVLTGDFISGEKAETYGIVNRITRAGEVVNEAVELARTIASRGRPAVIAGMRAVRDGEYKSIDEGLAIERSEFGKLCETENKEEGITAFLEKREARPIDK